jgi:starch phosphorylase
MRPKKFINKTNGVTPRRWLRACNPELTQFYDKLIGSDEWTLDMNLLKGLEKYADDVNTVLEFYRIKK